mmetsp:Transcript_38849/g.88228  ORF Transcript_38849/g.88228 Transcript_38849/m.88228 type:complete len:234 (-) Transcript_38849:308-1009(-)
MRMLSMRLLSPPSIILAPCPLPPSNPFHCSPLSTSLSPLDFTVRFPSMTSHSVTLPLPFSLPLPLPYSLPLPLPFRFPTAPFRYRSDSHSSTRRIPKPPNGLTLQVFSGAPSDGTCTHGDLELLPASFPASLTCLERHEEDRASCTCLQIRVGDPIDERVSSPDSDPDHAKSKEIRRVRPGGLALSASFLAVSASSSSGFDPRRSVLERERDFGSQTLRTGTECSDRSSPCTE